MQFLNKVRLFIDEKQRIVLALFNNKKEMTHYRDVTKHIIELDGQQFEWANKKYRIIIIADDDNNGV